MGNFLDLGDLKLYEDDYLAIYKETPLNLTIREFIILKILAKNRNRTIDRNLLYKLAFGNYNYETYRVIDVYVCRIRKKLRGDFIKTMKPIGYKFQI